MYSINLVNFATMNFHILEIENILQQNFFMTVSKINFEDLHFCCCLFGFYVTFNNFSVISRRCLVVTGSSMLTCIVLPH